MSHTNNKINNKVEFISVISDIIQKFSTKYVPRKIQDSRL